MTPLFLGWNISTNIEENQVEEQSKQESLICRVKSG